MGVSVGIVERAASRLGAAPPSERQAAGEGDVAHQFKPDLIERLGQTVHPGLVAPSGNGSLPTDAGSAHFLSPIELGRPATSSGTPPKIDIDFAVLRGRNFVTPGGERTRISEEFRRIKRHVLANVLKTNRGTSVNRVMVTSALPGDGKTFCSINLAMSLAMELDRSVILVDADTVKPNVLQSLGLEKNYRGLMDLLADPKLDPTEVICDTNIDKLRILPAGTMHPNSTELLASDGMRKLVATLADLHDDGIVIFDSPPLLVASEASALATHMSQILMVVAAGQTTEAAVKDALQRIQGCEGTVGMVLNKKLSHGHDHGYYGYGYGTRGYGTGHDG